MFMTSQGASNQKDQILVSFYQETVRQKWNYFCGEKYRLGCFHCPLQKEEVIQMYC